MKRPRTLEGVSSTTALLVNAAVAFVLLAAVLALPACEAKPAPAPQRKGVVSLAPHLTECVFALGQGSRLTGVTYFCDFPEEATKLPKVGGYIDPNLEKIASLTPELLLIAGQSPKITEFAKLRGIPCLNIDMDSLPSIDAGIVSLGKALECESEADALRARIQAELDAVRQAVSGLPRPKVLIITTRQEHNLNSLYTTHKTSFVSELVECAGGDNIYADATAKYPEASKETVVVKAPDVILEFHAGENLSQEEQDHFVADWDQLGSLPAVQQHRVYLVLEGHAMRPGPRVGEIARLLAKKLHPDAAVAQP